MKKKRVVITGLGTVCPTGLNVKEFTQSLKECKSGVARITAFDPSPFPVHIAAEVKNFNPENYMDKKRARRLDRFTQFILVAAKEAIQDANLDITKEDPLRIGVIMGSGIGGIATIEREHKVLLEKGPSRVSPFLIPMEIINMASGEVAIEFGFKGVNYAVSSACASSAHAIGDALRMLRYGDADVIISGGTEAGITPLGIAGFSQAGALSKRNDEPEKASRPFDKNRDGFVIAEGAAVFVLETLEHALNRGAKIYCELAGYGATDDAYHITAPEPTAEVAARTMALAIEDAEVSINDVDYINAHGTSTPLNDKTETLAIKKVFGKKAYEIPISSTKSMLGHLLGAASAIELLATIVCMNEGFIHPTINYETPDPECDLDYVPNTPRFVKFNCALSNSLGFGGHNATLLIKRYEP